MYVIKIVQLIKKNVKFIQIIALFVALIYPVVLKVNKNANNL